MYVLYQITCSLIKLFWNVSSPCFCKCIVVIHFPVLYICNQIAKIIRLTSIWRRFDAKVLDKGLIDVDPSVCYWDRHTFAVVCPKHYVHGSCFYVIWPWWRHQMEIFSTSMALCAWNSPVTGEFRAQRPVTRSFDVLFDLRLNRRLSKQSLGWWFVTPSVALLRQCNAPVRLNLHLWFSVLPGSSTGQRTTKWLRHSHWNTL